MDARWLFSLLMNLVTGVGVAHLLGARVASFWALVCGAIFLGNVVMHIVWSVATRSCQPGLITGVLYAPLFGAWLWATVQQEKPGVGHGTAVD